MGLPTLSPGAVGAPAGSNTTEASQLPQSVEPRSLCLSTANGGPGLHADGIVSEGVEVARILLFQEQPQKVLRVMPHYRQFAPGAYEAVPHSLLVIIPEDVDSSMGIVPPENIEFTTPCLKPQIRLQPFNPH